MERMQKNQLVELDVANLAFGGAGIAKVDDFVVFVTGAVPGDVVKARVTRLKKRYAEARVEQIVVPSPDRVRHRCPSFGACGGCVWQGLDYKVQLEYKTRQVRESLEHLGGLHDFELLPIKGMADPWRYRNRADFSIGMGADGAVVGFRPPGRWDSVLPLSECHLLEPSLEKVRDSVEAWLREEGLPGWDPRKGVGFARHLLVRSARAGSELLVSLVTIPGDLPGSERLVERLRAVHPQIVGVVHAVNAGRAELSSGLGGETLWGRPYLLEEVAGVALKVSVDAFFQTNSVMTDVLYEVVAEEAGRTTCSSRAAGLGVIWDLYSGVGAIGLSLAGDAQAVLGIEAVPAAVDDARENASRNGIENAFFVEGDVRRVLREVAEGILELPEPVRRPDVIIVDPPRAGLTDKAIARIGEVRVPRIVYVSCNPTTMGPNVARLQDYGYRLERVTPADMFPHTPHVECVGLLTQDHDRDEPA